MSLELERNLQQKVEFCYKYITDGALLYNHSLKESGTEVLSFVSTRKTPIAKEATAISSLLAIIKADSICIKTGNKSPVFPMGSHLYYISNAGVGESPVFGEIDLTKSVVDTVGEL